MKRCQLAMQCRVAAMQCFAQPQFDIQTLCRCDARNPLRSVSSVSVGALKKEIAAATRMLSRVATALMLEFNELVLLRTEKRLKLQPRTLERAHTDKAAAGAAHPIHKLTCALEHGKFITHSGETRAITQRRASSA